MQKITLKITGFDYSKKIQVSPSGEVPDGCPDYKKVALEFLKKINENIQKNKGKYLVNRNPASEKRTDSTLCFIGKKDDFSGNQNVDDVNAIEELRFDGIVGTLRDPNFIPEKDKTSIENQYKYDISVTVKSRFDKKDEGDKAFFMAHMILSYLRQSGMIDLTENEIPTEYDELFQFLKICVFRQKLRAAWDTGIFKKYTYFRRNDSKLRGRIDVARHIRLNAALDNGKIAYEYRENTPDNAVNHLILRTWLELKRAFPEMAANILSNSHGSDRSAEDILRELQYQAPGFRDRSLQNILRESAIPVTNPYFYEYEQLRRSCIDILCGLNYSLYTDEEESGENVESMLFYIPDLWEVHVQRLLEGLCEENGWSLDSQQIIKVLCEPEDFIVNGKPLSEPIKDGDQTLGTRYPDFVAKDHEDKPQFVLDAKFKPAWSHYEKDFNRLEDDIQQTLVYAMLENVRYTGVIFPVDNFDKSKKRTFDSPSSLKSWKIGKNDARFLICGLGIPSTHEKNGFEDWEKHIGDEEQMLKDALKEALKAALNV